MDEQGNKTFGRFKLDQEYTEASDASAVDNFYRGDLIHIDHGTGEGQSRFITNYVGSTKVVTINDAWSINPDTTSEYVVEEGHPFIDAQLSILASDLVIIESNSIIIESNTEAIHSQTTIIESNSIVVESNTEAIHSQTTIIESESTVIQSDVALLETTRAEPAQGTPGATIGFMNKIDFLYKAWRNKSTQTATEYDLYNDDTTTVDHKATVSDDATTFTSEEVVTGP